jgi:hypothetical protein
MYQTLLLRHVFYSASQDPFARDPFRPTQDKTKTRNSLATARAKLSPFGIARSISEWRGHFGYESLGLGDGYAVD